MRGTPLGRFGRRLATGVAVMAFGLGVGSWAGAQEAEEAAASERAAPTAIEEITVTGSYLRGTAEDGPSPVEVISRDDIMVVPTADLVEVIKKLPYNTGSTTAGSVQAFGGNPGGLANVNLHGLGPAQTLILLDGRRNSVTGNVIAGGQTYVNIDQFPKIVMERLEVLKEGAAATYGSDAVAGVVNFITRRSFEGFELRTDWTDTFENDSFKRGNVEAIYGWGNEQTHFVISGSHFYQDRYRATDNRHGFAVTHRGSGVGESTFGSPGAFLTFNATQGLWDGTLSQAFQDNGIYPAAQIDAARSLNAAFVQDPDCEAGGGTPVNTVPGATADLYRCSYSFIPFFDIASESYRWNAFGTFDHEFSDYAQVYASALYYRAESDHIGVSPSFPILNFGRDGVIPSFNPGNFTDRTVVYFGRPIAKAGGGLGIRSDGGQDQYSQRYELGLRGDLPFDLGIGENWHYDMGVLWHRLNEDGRAPDQRVAKWNSSLWGFGGPDCGPSNERTTAADVASGLATFEGRFVDMGQKIRKGLASAEDFAQMGNAAAGCFFWNPFGSAITHPDELGNGGLPLGNQEAVYRWFTEDQTITMRTSMALVDFVLAGDLLELPAGPLGLAVGLQWREEQYDVSRGANTILQPGEPADTFIFIPGGTVFDSDQDVFAVFAELNVPVTESLEAQLAVRHEDYGHRIGKSVDPKIALRWQALENLVFRTSLSTTFHAPALNQQFSERTALISNFDQGNFGYIQVPIVGNPTLQPEEAVTFNFGLIASPFEGFEITADYYRIKFDDMIVTSNQQAITNEENAINNAKGMTPVDPFCKELGVPDSTPGCFVSFDLITRVDALVGSARPIIRVRIDFSNAASTLTDGIDLSMSYDWSLRGLGDMRASFTGSHIIQYEFDGPGVDRDVSNNANFDNSVYPLPKFKFNAQLDWMPDEISRLSLLWRHVAPYEDDR
ncbi:MAG: TonB-dependent receptor, partial [Gemmatimonadota bacterium]